MSNPAGKRLGDIVNFKRGYDLPSYNRRKGEYPIISSGGISGYHAEFKIEGEGLVTGRYGTLGEAYYVNGKYWPHNTALYVTDFKGNYPKYVYFLMKCLGSLKTADKSTVPGVNRNDLHEIIVPYINPEYQKGIADFLFLIDAKIELNNRINADLEAMAKTLYDYWFVQFDFPDAQGKPYKSSGGKMVWHEVLKREIPAGWEVDDLCKVVEIKYGKDHKKLASGIIPVYGSGGIMRHANESIYDKESILIPRKGSLSNLFYVNKSFWSVDTMFYTKIKIDSIGKYLFFFLETLNLSSLNVGTAVPSLTTEVLNQLKIIIPPVTVLKNFQEKAIALHEKKEHNLAENQQLSALRDWLLPMLMNGQVKVS